MLGKGAIKYRSNQDLDIVVNGNAIVTPKKLRFMDQVHPSAQNQVSTQAKTTDTKMKSPDRHSSESIVLTEDGSPFIRR
jgi:hypothetical protein